MRKTMWQVPMAVATALCLAGVPAAASKGRAAEATYNFDMTEGGSVWVNDENVALTSANTVTFETTRADRTIALSVMDDAAGSVTAAMWQEGDSVMIFCDEMAAMPIRGGEPVYVQIMLDVTPSPTAGCASPEMPTAGTVTAAFTGGAKKKGHQHHH